jgi:hypothetical protein
VPQLEYPRTTPFCDRMIAPAVLAILPLVSHRFICAQWRGHIVLLHFGEAARPDLFTHCQPYSHPRQFSPRHTTPIISYSIFAGLRMCIPEVRVDGRLSLHSLRRENVQFSGKVRDTQTHPTAGRSWRCIISQSSEVRNTCQLSLPPPTATYPKWPLDLVLRALRVN